MADYCPNCGAMRNGKGKFCGHCGTPYQVEQLLQKNKKQTSNKKVIGIISILLVTAICVAVVVIIISSSKNPKTLLESNQWYLSYGSEGRIECIYFDTVYVNLRKDIDEIGSTKQVATYTVDNDHTIVTKYSSHVSSHTFIPLNENDIANGLYDISDDDWSVTEHYLIYNGKVYMEEEYFWDHYYEDIDE